MNLILKQCEDCNEQFFAELEGEKYCEECEQKHYYNPCGDRRLLNQNKWDDKFVQRQWQENSKKIRQHIIEKCRGAKYK